MLYMKTETLSNHIFEKYNLLISPERGSKIKYHCQTRLLNSTCYHFFILNTEALYKDNLEKSLMNAILLNANKNILLK